MTHERFGVTFPDNFKDIKFVETASGCFTLQIHNDSLTDEETADWETNGRLELAELTRKVIEELTGEPIPKRES